MTRKTDSHPHFLQQDGSIFRTETARDGAISRMGTTLKYGTIFYISEGTRQKREPGPTSAGPARVLAFPLHRHREKVIDVALKLARTRTRRHATYYRDQVSNALEGRLARRGVDPDCRRRTIAQFWQAVAAELARQRRKGGAA